MARRNQTKDDTKSPAAKSPPQSKKQGIKVTLKNSIIEKNPHEKKVINSKIAKLDSPNASKVAKLESPMRKNVTNTSYVSSLALKVVSPMYNAATINGKRISKLRCAIMKHIDSWCFVLRVEGHQWCDKLFNDDVKKQSGYTHDYLFDNNRFLWYHNNKKMVPEPSKPQFGTRMYGIFFNGKPSKQDALNMAKYIAKNFNANTLNHEIGGIGAIEHHLTVEDDSFFWLKHKNQWWSDIIGDVSALYMFKQVRKSSSWQGTFQSNFQRLIACI